MEHHIWLSVLGLSGVLALAVLLVGPAQRSSIPYTVLLAAMGIGLGLIVHFVADLAALGPAGDFLSGLDGVELTSDSVFFVFLPILVFEAALAINVRRLLDDIAPILLLAIVGLLISTGVVGMALNWSSELALIPCLLVGAIVSATDPVAVVAIFKDVGAPKRLAILVEGESLFNDATAIVLFIILSKMLTGQADASVLSGALSFVQTFVGGLLIGYAMARLLCALLQRIPDSMMVQTSLTISLAYLSFIVAEHYLHLSGVMAVVAAALVMGSRGRTIISPQNFHGIHETWEQVGFWANTVIFVLVGMAVPILMTGVDAGDLRLLGIILAAAMGVRAALIFGLVPAIGKAGLAQKVSRSFQTMMWWGGLRGAVSLGLALIVMENKAIDPDVRHLVATLVTGFVLFTLFVNATTVRAVMGFVGLDQLSSADTALCDRTISSVVGEIGQNLDGVARRQNVTPEVAKEISGRYRERSQKILERVNAMGEAISSDDWMKVGLTTLASQERKSYLSQFGSGFLGSDGLRSLLATSENSTDALKTDGVEGYIEFAEEALAFNRAFRIANSLERQVGYSAPLARAVAQRFEVLIGMRVALSAGWSEGVSNLMPLLGNVTGAKLRQIVDDRLEHVNGALRALERQYPEYALALESRRLERSALHLEKGEYQRMLDQSLISAEIHKNLQEKVDTRLAELDRAPHLDVGLDAKKLVAKVPLFRGLDDERIARIATLLHPQLVVPGQKIVEKGSSGASMYFVSNGAAHVMVDDTEVTALGSGDFFGEIALVTGMDRTADVIAEGFCELLVLDRNDFAHLLEEDAELGKTIESVARERLVQLGLDDSAMALGGSA